MMNKCTHLWIKQISMDNTILSIDEKHLRIGCNTYSYHHFIFNSFFLQYWILL